MSLIGEPGIFAAPRPFRIHSFGTPSGTVLDVTMTGLNLAPAASEVLLQGIDFACSGAVPNTFLCWAEVNSFLFYANEQEFSAGRGVAQYRGAIPIAQYETLLVHLETTAAVQLGITLWGMLYYAQPN